VTRSGEPPSGAGGADEPDWIDQILERATQHVDRGHNEPRIPIVPERQQQVAQPASGERPAAKQALWPADGLAEIRWVDSPPVAPPSTTIASAPAALPARPVTAEPGLVPQAVGRSAFENDLVSVGKAGEPEGWEKLSWQDLDDRPRDRNPIREQTSFGRLLREWGPVLFAAIVIALFTRLVLVQAYHIPSGSMIPTLEKGDRVVVNRLSYRFGEIERGQVIVLEKPPGASGDNDLIKRVIGLPGETVQFVNNQVYIDGFRIEESYLAVPDSTTPRSEIPGCVQVAVRDSCTIPEGFVFVMGDNRQHSSDSRVLGPIPIDTVVGRAFVRVWPLNNLGQL